MRFKTYIGSHTELPHLMEEARTELGPEAVIKTEYFAEGGFFGIGARKMVRVTAGVEDRPGESPFSIVRPDWAVAPAKVKASHGEVATVVRPAQKVVGGGSTNGSSSHVSSSRPEPRLSITLEPVAEEPPPPITLPTPPLDPEPEPIVAAAAPAPEPREPQTATAVEAAPAPINSEGHQVLQLVLAELRSLRAEVDDIRQRPAGAEGPPLYSPFVAEAYRRMVDRELSPQLARTIATMVDETLDPELEQTYEHVAKAIAELIVAHCTQRTVTEPLATAPRVVMLIGPTGVGKTTTLAKLAAACALLDDQAVALVTADTYRIAAIDQLKTFAQIINLPLEVVFDPIEFGKALELHAHQDVVLVDTAGRSPRDELKLAELKRFLEVSYPVETLLVMTATTKRPDLKMILDRFQVIGLDGVIITKLDETFSIGPVIELLWETHLPVRYLTNGQNVPDDLIRGEEAVLIRQLAEQLLQPEDVK